MAKKSLSTRLTKKKKPAPISMSLHKKPAPKKKAPAAVSEPINVPLVVAPTTVPDSDLVHRVAALESVGGKEIVVTMPVRPRIASVKIEYDNLGHPSHLIPAYTE